jgi:hypothetical protein
MPGSEQDLPTHRRQERLERETEAHRQMLAAARAEASAWAREALSDPHAVILDTETTGLKDSYAVQLAVITVTGTVLMDTLLNPQMAIPAEATAIHGITDEMVADAPLFADVLEDLADALHGRRVVIYNASFDTGVLLRELDRHYRATDPRPEPEPDRAGRHPSSERWMRRLGRVECAMETYAAFAGRWHDRFGDFTWQPLGGGHQALADCQMVITRLKEMAAADEPVQDPPPTPGG